LDERILHIMSRHVGQGLTPRRKVLLRGAAAVAIVISLALGMTGASVGGTQGAEASDGRLPWFKTASIKLNGAPAAETSASGSEFVAIEPAINMIMFAYGEKYPLKPAQVSGGPDWMKTEVFNIDAEMPKSLVEQIKPPLSWVGPPSLYPADVRQVDAMKHVFRSLLINRFELRIRRATKVLPVFELVLEKNGPKITEDKTADRPCRITDVGPRKGLWWNVESCDFRAFVGLLSAAPGARSRVLVDKTGLHGRYSFQLHWTPKSPSGTPKAASGAQSNPSATPAEPSGSPFLIALREQIGLNIVSAKAPVDVIVIEHIERPTEH
jgi:bla regulator protein blaR1